MTRSESDDGLPDEAAVGRALRDAGLVVAPSELHGSLCGYVAGGGTADRSDWLRRLHVDDEDAAGENKEDGQDDLDRLRGVTLAQFEDGQFGLELLLPDDETSLTERAEAMLAWCRGFLGGYGLAAPPADALSTESAEALQDLSRIAASDLGYDGSEEDEDALAEIIEFVRVVPMLVHADCVGAAARRRKAH